MKCEVATWVYLDENILTKSVFTSASSLKDDLTLHSHWLSLSLSLSFPILFHFLSTWSYIIHVMMLLINPIASFLSVGCRNITFEKNRKKLCVKWVQNPVMHSLSHHVASILYHNIIYYIYHTIISLRIFGREWRNDLELNLILQFPLSLSLCLFVDCTVFSVVLQKWPEYILVQELN